VIIAGDPVALSGPPSMRRAFLTARTLSVTIAARHKVAAMPSGPGEHYDFPLSRRGSVAAGPEALESSSQMGGKP
jgi:hypothetical protein